MRPLAPLWKPPSVISHSGARSWVKIYSTAPVAHLGATTVAEHDHRYAAGGLVVRQSLANDEYMLPIAKDSRLAALEAPSRWKIGI